MGLAETGSVSWFYLIYHSSNKAAVPALLHLFVNFVLENDLYLGTIFPLADEDWALAEEGGRDHFY